MAHVENPEPFEEIIDSLLSLSLVEAADKTDTSQNNSSSTQEKKNRDAPINSKDKLTGDTNVDNTDEDDSQYYGRSKGRGLTVATADGTSIEYPKLKKNKSAIGSKDYTMSKLTDDADDDSQYFGRSRGRGLTVATADGTSIEYSKLKKNKSAIGSKDYTMSKLTDDADDDSQYFGRSRGRGLTVATADGTSIEYTKLKKNKSAIGSKDYTLSKLTDDADDDSQYFGRSRGRGLTVATADGTSIEYSKLKKNKSAIGSKDYTKSNDADENNSQYYGRSRGRGLTVATADRTSKAKLKKNKSAGREDKSPGFEERNESYGSCQRELTCRERVEMIQNDLKMLRSRKNIPDFRNENIEYHYRKRQVRERIEMAYSALDIDVPEPPEPPEPPAPPAPAPEPEPEPVSLPVRAPERTRALSLIVGKPRRRKNAMLAAMQERGELDENFRPISKKN